MNGLIDSAAVWLADFPLLATALLALVLVALAMQSQPVRRLVVVKSALVALALVAALCAVPGWSVVHLITAAELVEQAAPATATVADSASNDMGDWGRATASPPSPDDLGARLRLDPSDPAPQPTVTQVTTTWSWSKLPWPTIAVSAYAAGSTLVLLWLAIGAMAAYRLRRRATPAGAELAKRFADMTDGAKRTPNLLVSDEVDTAIALGVFRPIVILPWAWTETKSPVELRSVLAHEWTHVKNGDLQWLAVSRAMFVLLWAHPLFWILRRRMRLDQEALADAAAAETTGRQTYAAELVAWARSAAAHPRMPVAAAVGLWEGPSQLRRRIALLLDERFTVLRSCSRYWRVSAAIGLIAAALALSLVTVQPRSLAQTDVVPQQEAIDERGDGEFADRLVLFGTASPSLRDGPGELGQPAQPNTITGRYVDEVGQPLDEVEVSLYKVDGLRGGPELLARVLTDANGSYRFAPAIDVEKMFPDGKLPRPGVFKPDDSMVTVVARQPGRAARISYRLSIPNILESGIQFAQVMRPAATLRGRVTGRRGPIAGAFVSFGSSPFEHFEGVRSARTDANGNYVIDDAEAHDFARVLRQDRARQRGALEALFMPPVVTVEHPDFAVKTVLNERIPGTTDIRLEPALSITGRVLNGQTDRPAAGVTVIASMRPSPMSVPDAAAGELLPIDPNMFARQRLATKTDAEGRYGFRSLPQGDYDIWTEEEEMVHPGFHLGDELARLGLDRPETFGNDARDFIAPDMILTRGGLLRVQLIDDATREAISIGGGEEAVLDLAPRVGNPPRPWTSQRRAPVEANGRFETRYHAGEFQFVALEIISAGEPQWSLSWEDSVRIMGGVPPIAIQEGETTDVRLRVRKIDLPSAPGAAVAADSQQEMLARVARLLFENEPQQAKELLAAHVTLETKDVKVLLPWAEAQSRLGEYKESVSTYERILSLDLSAARKLIVLNNLAYLLAAAPDDAVRDGRRALELASSARQLAEQQLPDALAGVLDTLAAAHAEAGDFEKAVETEQQAIELAHDADREAFRQHLALYQSGQPLRVETPSAPSTEIGDQSVDKQAAANEQPVEINLVVAKHVMLLNGKKIVTREEVEKLIADLPNPAQTRIRAHVTRAAQDANMHPSIVLWGRELQARFGVRSNLGGVLGQAASARFDAIRSPADLVPDASLRKVGTVEAADGRPLNGAEVVLLLADALTATGNILNVRLDGPRLSRPLEEMVTRSDEAGFFYIYPEKDKPYCVVVLHEQGFALVRSEAFANNPSIRVAPWGKVSGTMAHDERYEQSISLRVMHAASDAMPALWFHQPTIDSTKLGPDGKFHLTNVIPDRPASLYRFIRTPDGKMSFGVHRTIQVAPGETLTFNVNPITDQEWANYRPVAQPSAAQDSPARDGSGQPQESRAVEPGQLAGRVIDEQGRPLANVVVDAWTWVPGTETTTDVNGRFSLEGFEPNESVQVEFRLNGYAPALFTNQKAGTRDWTITVNNRTYIEGKVLGPDSRPVPFALVRAMRGPFTTDDGSVIGEVWTEVSANSEGEYRLHLEPDKYDVQLRVPTVGIARRQDTTIAAGEKRTFDIQLQPGPTFRATILDGQTNEPVEGIRLWYWMKPGIEGTSNDDGQLTIENVPPGAFNFNVAAAGAPPSEVAGEFARWWSPDAVHEQQRLQRRDGDATFQRNLDGLTFNIIDNFNPVKIFLEKAVTITGRIIDPEGQPVAGATVAPAKTGTANSITGDTRYSVLTAADGTFTMRLPASGNAKYNLVAHDGKYREWRKWANGVGEVIQTKPGDKLSDVVLKLTRPCVVRGKVIDAQGRPMANQTVKSQPADWMENRYYDPETKTNEQGEFELKFVRPGEQFVQIGPMSRSPGMESDHSLSVMQVTADPDRPVEQIVLTPE